MTTATLANQRKSKQGAEGIKEEVYYRIASYFTPELIARLESWCKENKMDRNDGLQYAVSVMIPLEDDSPEGRTLAAIYQLEQTVINLRAEIENYLSSQT